MSTTGQQSQIQTGTITDPSVFSSACTNASNITFTTNSSCIPTNSSYISTNIQAGGLSANNIATGSLQFTPSITTAGTTAAGTSGTLHGGTYQPNIQYYPVQQPPVVQISQEDGELIVQLTPKKECKYFIRLIPGVKVYSPGQRPGLFRRTVLGLLFGIKWESTLIEHFVNNL